MAAAIVPAEGRVHQARGDRHIFATSDEDAMMKQIQTTHVPDGREVDVKPLIYIIEDIMHRATPSIPGLGLPLVSAQLDTLEDVRTLQDGFSDMLELLTYPINRISCEISCNSKVVIALAAFAVNYGEFGLVAQLYPSNPLAKCVAFLKHLPDMLKRTDSLKPKFEALINLIKAMLDVTKCIIEFKELPSQYITPDMSEMVFAIAYTPTAIYWTIRSIVAYASEIMNLIGMGHKYMTLEVEQLSSLGYKVNNIHNQLQKQLIKKDTLIHFTRLLASWRQYTSTTRRSLKALICAKEDQLPLIDGNTKKKVHIDVLRRKNVLLLISNVDLFYEEHLFLHQLYIEAQQHPKENQYEVVWIPVMKETIPWDEVHQNKFEHIQASILCVSRYLIL
ncbi:unnamed protein product [Camellia sinensis]